MCRPPKAKNKAVTAAIGIGMFRRILTIRAVCCFQVATVRRSPSTNASKQHTAAAIRGTAGRLFLLYCLQWLADGPENGKAKKKWIVRRCRKEGQKGIFLFLNTFWRGCLSVCRSTSSSIWRPSIHPLRWLPATTDHHTPHSRLLRQGSRDDCNTEGKRSSNANANEDRISLSSLRCRLVLPGKKSLPLPAVSWSERLH